MTRATGGVAGALVGALSGGLLWDLLTAHTLLGAALWVLPLAAAYAAVGASLVRVDAPTPAPAAGPLGLTVLPGHPLPTRAVAHVPTPRRGAPTAG